MHVLERRLLSKIVEKRDTRFAINKRLRPEHFLTRDGGDVFRTILDYQKEYGEVPSFDTLTRMLPRFDDDYIVTDENPEALVDALLTEYVGNKVVEELNKVDDDSTLADPFKTAALLADRLRQLSSLKATNSGYHLSSSETINEVLHNYEITKEKGGMLGIPYPWPSMNFATRGMQNQDLIVFYGRPKSMKTWLVTCIAAEAYWNHRKRVLFFSYEMSAAQIIRRTIAILAGLDYTAFVNGSLTPDQEQNLKSFTVLKEYEQLQYNNDTGRSPAFVIEVDNERTIASAEAKIKEFDPDLVVADSFYKMTSSAAVTSSLDWKNVANLSSEWKRVAQRYNIPVLLTTQANRSAVKTRGNSTDEMAFHDGGQMDADLIVRVLNDGKKLGDEDRSTFLELRSPGMREGDMDHVFIAAKPAKHFQEILNVHGVPMTEEEIEASYGLFDKNDDAMKAFKEQDIKRRGSTLKAAHRGRKP